MHGSVTNDNNSQRNKKKHHHPPPEMEEEDEEEALQILKNRKNKQIPVVQIGATHHLGTVTNTRKRKAKVDGSDGTPILIWILSLWVPLGWTNKSLAQEEGKKEGLVPPPLMDRVYSLT